MSASTTAVRSVLAVVAWVVLSGAAEPELPPIPAFQLHASVSQGFIKSTRNNYLAESQRGSFEFTEVLLNLVRPLDDELTVGFQLFARDLGPLGNYEAKFDWFFLEYRPRDAAGLRAGRVKLPFGLYNEVSDYDAGRLPVLLPQSVYPTNVRDFLLALTGFQLFGYLGIGELGALDYSLHGGTLFIDTSESAADVSLDVPYAFGARVMWDTPVTGLRAGGSVLSGLLTTSFTVAGAPLSLDLSALLWVGSIEYIRGRGQLAAEYSRWHLDVQSAQPAVVPSALTISERAYFGGAWAWTDSVQTGAYYSLLFPNIGAREGREGSQHDVALTLRLDLTQYWLLKFEGHYLHGTAALQPELNGDRPRSQLTPDWGLFLVKTTVYF